MKVLQIITSLNTGGAEKLIVDSIPIYEKKGINMDLIILNNNKTPFRSKLEKTMNGQIIGFTNKSIYNPFLIFKLIPYLKKYDLVHVHLFPSLYWVVLAKWISFSKVSIIYTEHSTSNKRRKNILFKHIDRFIYSKFSFVGCISEASKTNLISHLKYKKNNISVILNGINLEEFDFQSKIDYKFYNDDSFILIQVSSFREQKDQKTLIKALEFLPDKVKLILVGGGHLRGEHEELVRNLKLENRVKFLGIRKDVPSLMKYSDVNILSSHYEGFGLAVLEGMALKKPSIASDVEGVREIVKDYGLLFEKGNSKELADHIINLMDDKSYYDKIAKQCYDRAQKFDINTMVEKYIVLYKKLSKK